MKPGKVSADAGMAAYEFLCTAIDLTMAGQADAIVTCPLHKEGLRTARLPYPGHTEILAERTGTVATPRNARFLAGEFPDVREFRFPLIIKPTIRTHTSGWTGFRLRILENASEVQQCLEEVAREHPGRAMQIAENIPGEPDQLYTVGSYSNAAGKVLRSYTGRKLTQ